MKFVIFPAKDGFRFHLKAANGEIVLQSEAYTRKHDAERAINMIKAFGPKAEVVFQAEQD